MPNTRRALRLTELARTRGLHRKLHDRLMDAYWAEAIDIGNGNELLRLAEEAGLDGTEAERVLESDEHLETVLRSTAQAQSIGITGIPAFLLDQRLLVLGAQPREVFEQAFAQL